MWFIVTPRMPYFSDRDYRLSMLAQIRGALVERQFEIELPRHATYNRLRVCIGAPLGVCEFMPSFPAEELKALQRLPLVGEVRELVDIGMCPPDPEMFAIFSQE
jgi:hypothetical protein